MYIDPGTTGQVVGSSVGVVIAVLAGVLGTMGLFFKKIKAKLGKTGVVAVVLAVPVILLVAYWLLTK